VVHDHRGAELGPPLEARQLTEMREEHTRLRLVERRRQTGDAQRVRGRGGRRRGLRGRVEVIEHLLGLRVEREVELQLGRRSRCVSRVRIRVVLPQRLILLVGHGLRL